MWTLFLMTLGCQEGSTVLDDGEFSADTLSDGGQDGALTDDDDSTIDEDQGGDGGALVSVREGRWVSSAEVIDDACGFTGVLDKYYRLSIVNFMPRSFSVTDALPGAFSIEADDYGTFGAIDCDSDENWFQCEQQVAQPTDNFVREGWEYVVDFEGELVSRDRIEGVAVVNYGLRALSWESTLSSYGIDLDDCPTTFALTLVYVD